MGAAARVLIVDDEPAFLRVLTAAVRLLGCETVAALDAESAWDLLHSTPVDLAIVDVRLPGIDGPELTRKIKDAPHLSTIPVVLMSAFGKPAAPADGFIGKPFRFDDLSRLIGPYLAYT